MDEGFMSGLTVIVRSTLSAPELSAKEINTIGRSVTNTSRVRTDSRNHLLYRIAFGSG
jgi:hypothetical protein